MFVLAARIKLTGINQLWVADITYIRVKAEFVYLAVVLDAYSRKVVGWALQKTLAARLPLAALEQAMADARSQRAASRLLSTPGSRSIENDQNKPNFAELQWNQCL